MRTRVALSIWLAACGGGSGGNRIDAGTTDERQQVASISATPNRDLDLLFVIDNSGSMADKQNNLAVNFPNFINVLSNLEGGLPNLHIGVISTDMGTKGVNGTPGPGVGTVGQGGCANAGDNGALLVGGAQTSVNGRFISDVRAADGTRIRNYTGELATVFSQMARLGARGCGFEQPLHAMRVALSNQPANAGFLRPDALLGVVFLTDEDDCTPNDASLFAAGDGALGPLTSFRCTRFGVTCAQGGQTSDQMNQVGMKGGCTAAVGSQLMHDVEPFVTFLKGLKADPKHVLVAGIIGPLEPFAVETRQINGTSQNALAHSCTYQGPSGPEVGDPGVRLETFFRGFPERSSFTNICQPDLSVSLEQLGLLVNRTVGSPCVSATLRDVDPSTPGLQPDCIVEDVVGATATAIGKCGNPEAPPCWRLEVDPVRCPQFENLRLVVARTTPPEPQTVTNMRCLVQ